MTADILPFWAADDLSTHHYRRQVARELEVDWGARARALRDCGEAGAAVRCGCCASPHVLPFRCGARTCPSCARIASAVSVDRLMARVGFAFDRRRMEQNWEGQGWERRKGWYKVTFTQQEPDKYGDDARFKVPRLAASLRRLRDAFPRFYRATAWGARVRYRTRSGRMSTRTRHDVAWALGLEVAPGGLVHAHALFYGERIEERDLRAAWQSAIARRGQIHMRKVHGESPDELREALTETLKYVGKGEKGTRRYERAAAVELALRGIRRVEMGGALRTRGELVGPRDLVYHDAAACPCGGARGWEWVGIVPPLKVLANGGFGIATTTDAEKRIAAVGFERWAAERLRLNHERTARPYNPPT